MIAASLLDSRHLWRAHQLVAPDDAGHPTGFAALDAELPDGGWPRAGMVELLGAHQGVEWSLLAPWLQEAPAQEAGPVVCLSPPHNPHVPAFQQVGFDIQRFLFVRAASVADAAWAGEQVLQTACQALIWWVSADFKRLSPLMLRRIHLASVKAQAPVFVLSPPQTGLCSSPAPLRLMLEKQGTSLAVTVFKRRGPPMLQPLKINLPGMSQEMHRRLLALTQKQKLISPQSQPLTTYALAGPVPADLVA